MLFVPGRYKKTTIMKSEIVMMIRQSSVRDRYIGISIASIYR